MGVSENGRIFSQTFANTPIFGPIFSNLNFPVFFSLCGLFFLV